MPDYFIRDLPPFVLVVPISEEATDWLDEHVPEGQYWSTERGAGLVVEPPYLDNLLAGMAESGFVQE